MKPGIPLVLNSENDKAVLSTMAQGPGSMETIELRQSGAGSETASFNVPVLDGTLAEYKNLVPTTPPVIEATTEPTPEASATPSAEATVAP